MQPMLLELAHLEQCHASLFEADNAVDLQLTHYCASTLNQTQQYMRVSFRL